MVHSIGKQNDKSLLQLSIDNNNYEQFVIILNTTKLDPKAAHEVLKSAINQQRTKMAILLIENGASVNTDLANINADSPLYLAAKTRRFKLIKILFEHGARIDPKAEKELLYYSFVNVDFRHYYENQLKLIAVSETVPDKKKHQQVQSEIKLPPIATIPPKVEPKRTSTIKQTSIPIVPVFIAPVPVEQVESIPIEVLVPYLESEMEMPIKSEAIEPVANVVPVLPTTSVVLEPVQEESNKEMEPLTESNLVPTDLKITKQFEQVTINISKQQQFEDWELAKQYKTNTTTVGSSTPSVIMPALNSIVESNLPAAMQVDASITKASSQPDFSKRTSTTPAPVGHINRTEKRFSKESELSMEIASHAPNAVKTMSDSGIGKDLSLKVKAIRKPVVAASGYEAVSEQSKVMQTNQKSKIEQSEAKTEPEQVVISTTIIQMGNKSPNVLSENVSVRDTKRVPVVVQNKAVFESSSNLNLEPKGVTQLNLNETEPADQNVDKSSIKVPIETRLLPVTKPSPIEPSSAISESSQRRLSAHSSSTSGVFISASIASSMQRMAQFPVIPGASEYQSNRRPLPTDALLFRPIVDDDPLKKKHLANAIEHEINREDTTTLASGSKYSSQDLNNQTTSDGNMKEMLFRKMQNRNELVIEEEEVIYTEEEALPVGYDSLRTRPNETTLSLLLQPISDGKDQSASTGGAGVAAAGLSTGVKDKIGVKPSCPRCALIKRHKGSAHSCGSRVLCVQCLQERNKEKLAQSPDSHDKK